jgi:DNA invertase Pin-like site-specific DNA recombinase
MGNPLFMNIGYCRISTDTQNDALQLDALNEAGCERIFSDVASGAKTERSGLKEAIAYARSGDVLVCYKLDRVGRSLKDLIDTVNLLKERGIGFRVLTQQLDTTTPAGMLIFHVFGAIAEFEKSLIQERTSAGLKAARARGRVGGRPKTMDQKKLSIAESLYKDGKTNVSEICKTLGISRATFYRNISAKAA